MHLLECAKCLKLRSAGVLGIFSLGRKVLGLAEQVRDLSRNAIVQGIDVINKALVDVLGRTLEARDVELEEGSRRSPLLL